MTLLTKAQRAAVERGERIPRKHRKRRTKAEQAEKFAREYGSAERVAWIAAHGCLACARVPSENAHTANGGMGRKADADTIVPLCAAHHHELHRVGITTFEREHTRMLCGRTLTSWAQTYAEAWTKWCAA